MPSFPQNPGPPRNQHRTTFGRAQQHQAQHSSLVLVSGPAVYPFSIRPLTLSPARAQQPHVRPRKSPARPNFGTDAGPVGSNLTSLICKSSTGKSYATCRSFPSDIHTDVIGEPCRLERLTDIDRLCSIAQASLRYLPVVLCLAQRH